LNKPASIGFARREAPDAALAERLRAWTRTRFALHAEDTVMVAEVECVVPGCPPLETVIAFWIEDTRHHFKVFKPIAEVVEDDLPPAWLKAGLADIPGEDCSCC
jgi:nitrate reductase delta subunit